MPSLSLLVLKTRQLAKVRDFYAALGIEFKEEQHGKGPVHYSGRLGNLVLEIYPLPEGVASADTTTRLGFTVENLSAAIDAVLARGSTIITQPQMTQWGFRAIVRDPDGRAVALTSDNA